MTEQPKTEFQRKLAAIMFTDIYGYSRQMSLDENKALRMLDKHDEIVEGVIKEHEGHILKRMGDAVFAEFESAAAALTCAVKIQTGLKEYNDTQEPEDRIIIRIGLHAGDVVVRGDDLFGEGINVAARLEPLADPGGVCLSQTIYDAVKDDAETTAVKVGDVELKNILKPYTIFKIPSFYGDEFQGKPITPAEKEQYTYKVKGIKPLPVKRLSPKELAIWSFVIAAVCLIAAAFTIHGDISPGAFAGFSARTWTLLMLATLALAGAMIYFYAASSMRVSFADIRDVDRLMEFLVTRIGYRKPLRTQGGLVFKPSFYNFFMYGARKIRTIADGSSVVITGNFMFVRKLKKMIKAYESGS